MGQGNEWVIVKARRMGQGASVGRYRSQSQWSSRTCSWSTQGQVMFKLTLDAIWMPESCSLAQINGESNSSDDA